MQFVSELDEKTMILIEAEASAAFGKNELEVRPDPLRAYLNAITMAGQMSRAMSDGLAKHLTGSDIETEVQFGLRIDDSGSVMLAMMPSRAQITVTVRRSGRGRG